MGIQQHREVFSRRGNGKVATLVALLGLGSAAIWFYRDARTVVNDFGPAEGSRCVNVNTADVSTLATLPGVGEVLAHRIIAGRPYSKVDDPLRVSGIGERSLAPQFLLGPSSLRNLS